MQDEGIPFLLNEQILLANNYSRVPTFSRDLFADAARWIVRVIAVWGVSFLCARILFKSAIVHRRDRRGIREFRRNGWSVEGKRWKKARQRICHTNSVGWNQDQCKEFYDCLDVSGFRFPWYRRNLVFLVIYGLTFARVHIRVFTLFRDYTSVFCKFPCL